MSIAKIFADRQAFAKIFPQYVVREGQIKMAEAVSTAIANRSALVVEAGTGIGKTLAYLIPAISSGGKIMISTGTKALQDQLFLRDLPNVCKALSLPISMALLKGRANYVCHYHLGQALNNPQFSKEYWGKDLREISVFAQNSTDGDKADCRIVADKSPAWAYAVSTRDNCLGNNCPNAADCFLLKARKKALDADVLVVNHHLFFADIAIKENGGQELLPDTHIIIFDEAHQVKDIASDFFSDSFSTAQLRELARDARKELMSFCADMPETHKHADAIEYKSTELLFSMQDLPERTLQVNAIKIPHVKAAFDELISALKTLEDTIFNVSERSMVLQKIHERTNYIHEVLKLWLNPPLPTIEDLPNASQLPESELIKKLQKANSHESIFIHWLEKKERFAKIVRTPLSIAESMQRQYQQNPRTWIFCSATLAIGNDFKMLKRDLGLNDFARGCEELVINSPFDYVNNSRLYIPKNLPVPSDSDYFAKMVAEIVPLINNCKGGVFILCTSYRAVTFFNKLLPEIINNRPILTQNEMANHQLLAEFRAHGSAILIGTLTFWEGVDFQGPTLSMVIIDKLPFAPPDDPLQNAVGEEIKKSGGNVFYDLQIPQAAILLKQGAGRLIRSESDKGVLVICDSRLISKGYGQKLLKAIPPMGRAENQQQVIEFLQKID